MAAVLPVLVAADAGDAHGDAVVSALTAMGVSTTRISASLLPALSVSWQPGSPLLLDAGGARWAVTPSTTVWWRRPGQAFPSVPDPLEARLVQEEAAVLLPGLLEASGARWVDPPWVLQRARLKLVQLATARALQLDLPPTLVTGVPVEARLFEGHGPTVAKALSSGIGIAPYVAVVPSSELDRVRACPTLLQRLVGAESDLRVVTVAERVFAWGRRRDDLEGPDWRATDPRGARFERRNGDPTQGGAVRLATALGLTFSVQDWLECSEGPCFLEVNVQGQWLFLAGAESTLLPALIEHLVG